MILDTWGEQSIELRFFAIQDVVNRQNYLLKYFTSKNNAANIIIKARLPHAHKLGTGRLHMAVLQ